jgi:hypothetical protein
VTFRIIINPHSLLLVHFPESPHKKLHNLWGAVVQTLGKAKLINNKETRARAKQLCRFEDVNCLCFIQVAQAILEENSGIKEVNHTVYFK